MNIYSDKTIFTRILSALLIISMALPIHSALALRPTGLEESAPTKQKLIQELQGASSGLEEVVWKVEPGAVKLAPVVVKTGDDGITVPIGDVIYPNQKKGRLKLVLPPEYRLTEARSVTVSVDHQMAQIYPRPDGRFANGYVVRIELTHEGRPVIEYFAFKGEGNGFDRVIPGITALLRIALSNGNWLDQTRARALGPFPAETTRYGRIISLGNGTYPGGATGPVQLELPREQLIGGRASRPVTLRMEWREKAYPQPKGEALDGYVIVATVDPGTADEQTFQYRFAGQPPGLISPQMDELIDDVADAIIATEGRPGDLLDVLLALHSERYTREQIQSFIRRFEELNLGEMVERRGRGGMGRGRILLEFYFQQASLVNSKEERDRQTLIQVFLKVAFRELASPATRQALMDQVEARESEGLFFKELAAAAREMVEKAMVYQPAHIKTRLLPHQSVGGYFLSHHAQAYNGDSTGLGKSIESLAGMDPSWKVFIAAPASLVPNWRKEISKHIDPATLKKIKVVVLRGTPEQKRKQIEDLPPEGCICIGSIQGLRFIRNLDEANLQKMFGGNLDLLIVDESQFGANYRGQGAKTNAQQAEALQVIPSKRRWYLSATGYGSNPMQLFATLAALTRGTPEAKNFEDFRRFSKLYPPEKAEGLRYLRAEMRRLSIARESEEVMDRYENPAVSGVPLANQGLRLPNLVEVPYREAGAYVLNDEQILLLLQMVHNFRDFAEWYNGRVPAEQRLDEEQMNPFTKLRFIFYLLMDPKRVGGETVSPIWPALDHVVAPYLARGKKGILYVQNQAIAMEPLLSRFGGQNVRVARIDGTVSGHASHAAGLPVLGYFGSDGELVIDPLAAQSEPVDAKTYQKHLFQSDPNVPLVAVGARAGGVGLDLTAAEFQVDVQSADYFTQERQMNGRAIRPDPKRPRLNVDKIRMVGVFPENFTPERILAGEAVGSGLVVPEEYRELAARLAQSGTPAELAVERLSVGKRVFQYVMLDLATDKELDMFDPSSLGQAIPGFMEDPTMEQYLSALSSERLQETLQVFLPLYQQAQDAEMRREILRLAELYFRTGRIKDLDKLLEILAQEDVGSVELIASLLEIPNRYAREAWLNRLIPMVTTDFPANNLGLSDIAASLDFLAEDAPFLVLPLVHTIKGFENGGVVSPLTQLLAEVEQTVPGAQDKRLIYQQFALWMLAVGSKTGLEEDPRDALHELLNRHGSILTDRTIPLADRLSVTEQLLRLVSFPSARQLLLRLNSPIDLNRLRDGLRQAAEAAVQEQFDLSPSEAGNFVQRFPAYLTALQIQGGLRTKYPEQAKRLSEEMLHVARGDYAVWRNEQQGDRLQGDRVTYREDQPELWAAFTREESVLLDQPVLVNYERQRAQMVEQAQQILAGLTAEESAIIGQVEGEWVRGRFRQWADRPNGFRKSVSVRRRTLAEARRSLLNDPPIALKESETAAIKQEEMKATLEPAQLAVSIEERLKEYGRVDEWLQFVRRTQGLSEKVPTVGELAELRTLAAQLTGRAAQAGAVHLADSLEELSRALTRLREKQRVDGVRVQFTTDPSLMIERGMLHPHLVDCFNAFGNPDQTAGLIDDLGSRNKILALVWPKSVPLDSQGRPDLQYKDRILARVVVKVKRTEDGTPVLFPERPLAAGAYRFEPEILEALKQAKMPELAPLGVRLGREGKSPSKKKPETRIWLYDTGGYGEWEYFEPLFKIMRRPDRSEPIHHRGEILESGLEERQTPANPPIIDFLSGVGYEKIQFPAFVHLLQTAGIDLLLDVRENNYSYRPDFSKGLGGALEAAGIHYVHAKSLGAPKAIRELHDLGKNDAQFMKEYADYLAQHGDVVDAILPQLAGHRVALLCYEANPDQCHRTVVAQAIANRAEIRAPVIDIRQPLLPIAERVVIHPNPLTAAPSSLVLEGVLPPSQDSQVAVYLDPVLSQGKWKVPGSPFKTVGKVSDSFWNDAAVSKSRWVAFLGVSSYSSGGKTAFSFNGRAYRTDRSYEAGRLLILADPRHPNLPTAYDLATGEHLYPHGQMVFVYLQPKIQEGRLVDKPVPYRIMNSTPSQLDRLGDFGDSDRIAFWGVPAFGKEGGQSQFRLFGTTYETQQTYDANQSLRLLVEADTESGQPITAYSIPKGEIVYQRSAGQGEKISVYLDPEIKNGQMIGQPNPFRSYTRVPPSFWNQEGLEKADRLVFGNYPTSYDNNGNITFSVLNRTYRTRRIYNQDRRPRFWVVLDLSTRMVLEAYDQEGKQVYPSEGMSHIYLNPEIIRGRLKEGSKPFLSVDNMGTKTWGIAEIQQAREIALASLPTIHHNGTAIFHLNRGRYFTNRSFDAEHELRLLVLVNPITRLPRVAYDMESGEEVYPASLDPIKIYIDPPMEGGVIQSNPRPVRVALQVPAGFFDRQDVQQAKRVVLADVSTYNRAGKAAFSLLSQPYGLDRLYSSKSPLKLSIVINAQNRKVLAAYDQETGEQVYPRSDSMPVYLDPLMEKGFLVGSPPPATQVLTIDNSFWTEADVQKSNVVVVENMATHNQSGKLAFSVEGNRYRTIQPVDSPDQAVFLRVVLNSKTHLPTAAFNQVTGKQVYPFLRPMQIYLNSPIEEGRLTGEQKPFHEGERISPKVWNGPEIQAAPIILLSNVRTYNIHGNAAFTLFTRMYSTSKAYDSTQPLYLNVLVNPRTRKPFAAYEMETGKQIYPKQVADEKLQTLAQMASQGDGAWVTDGDQSGLEEVAAEVVEGWAEGREAHGLMVVSPEVLNGSAGTMIRQTVARLPAEVADSIVLPSDGATAQDVAMTILEQDPMPDRVWVVGSFGPAFTGILRGFTNVTELASGSGLEEFLAQVGLMLGVPANEIETGLEEIRNASGLQEAA